MSNVQLDKVSVSPSTLKLPQLFSMTPSSGKVGNVQRRHGNASQTSQTENLSDSKSLDAPSNNEVASSEGALFLHKFCQNILLGIKKILWATTKLLKLLAELVLDMVSNRLGV
jgi:hypothetical protein